MPIWIVFVGLSLFITSNIEFFNLDQVLGLLKISYQRNLRNYVVHPPVAQFWSHTTKTIQTHFSISFMNIQLWLWPLLLLLVKKFLTSLWFIFFGHKKILVNLYLKLLPFPLTWLGGMMAQWWSVSDQLTTIVPLWDAIDQCNWHRYQTIHSATNRITSACKEHISKIFAYISLLKYVSLNIKGVTSVIL